MAVSWYTRGDSMNFEIVGAITSIKTIATGPAIRDLPRLRRRYGSGRWRKVKASPTSDCLTGQEAALLSPGRHVLEVDFKFDFTYDRLGMGTPQFANMSGLGRGGTGVLRVDGTDVGKQQMERTIPVLLPIDECLDISSATLTGVNDEDYQLPFTFTGKLNMVTLSIERPQLTPEDIKKLEAAEKQAAAAKE